MAEIINELIQMRQTRKESQRAFAKRAGINHGLVQRLESREQNSIAIDDMAKWLIACGADPAMWFSRYLSASEQKQLDRDPDFAKRLGRALRIPRRRKVIENLLDGWAFDDERVDRTPQ